MAIWQTHGDPHRVDQYRILLYLINKFELYPYELILTTVLLYSTSAGFVQNIII